MLLVQAGAVALSFSPVVAKLAHTGPTATGFYRMAFGGLGLLGLALVRRQPPWSGGRSSFLVIACGGFFALDLIFWHRSILHVGPGLATLLGNFQVLFLAAFGLLVLRERVTWRLVTAIPLAVIGLYLLVAREWGGGAPSYRLGVMFGPLTAVSYAVYLLTLCRAQASEPARAAVGTVATLSIYAAAMLAIVAPLQPALAFVWDILLFERPTSVWQGLGAATALGAIYLGSLGRAGPRARDAGVPAADLGVLCGNSHSHKGHRAARKSQRW